MDCPSFASLLASPARGVSVLPRCAALRLFAANGQRFFLHG